MAAAEQNPLKLGAKVNLFYLPLSRRSSIHGAGRNSGNFFSSMQKAQEQHPFLHSLLCQSKESGLQEKKNKETTSWSLRPSQRKLVKMFQPGHKSSRVIKRFTQTPSLTPPWAPCTTSHTARLATYKIEANDHEHKKELCFAAMRFKHSSRPAPQEESGFLPVSFRKRFQPANYPHYTHGRSGHSTAKEAPGTFCRGRSSRRALHSPVADPCPGWFTGYTVSQILGAVECWGTPSLFALDFLIALLSTASLRFSS